jgi:RHS repeat-associated protein
MLEAAKFGDPVIGIDIHMVLVPAPPAPAPIPTPLPHPFVGVVFDPLGALLGAALSLAFGGGGPVLINFMPCGNTGTEVKGVPHFPTPPGVSFAPNDIPSNDGTLIFGSKTVTMAGSSIARLTDMVMTCNFPINLPTSVCMAVPMGAPVLVGGPPSLDIMAAVTKAIRTRWFSDLLHRISGGRFSKIICFLTGHPVDVMTGELLTDDVDFELPGPLPLRFERSYCSRSAREGPLGKGWAHSLDMWVHEDDWRLVVRLADGRERHHGRLPEGASLWDDADRYDLERTPWGYCLTTAEGVTYSFAKVEGARVTHPLVRVSDHLGRVIRLQYACGQLDEVTDCAGRALRFEHHPDGRLAAVRVKRPGDGGARWMTLARYEYDREGMLSAAFDALGLPYRYEYRGGVMVKETDRNGLNFYFEYDANHPEGWCTRTWGDGGLYDHRLTYDKGRHVTLVDDSRGGREHYFGNAAGLVVKRIDPEGGAWKYEWDARYRKVAEEDPLGLRAEWGYDARGHKVFERDPAGGETRWAYDDRGHLVERVDPAGRPWRREYDARGLIARSTDPGGGAYTYRHDARGNLVEVCDPTGKRLTLRYDAADNVVEGTDWEGAATTRAYDDLGNLTRMRDPLGRETTLTHDARGQVIAMAWPDGARVTREYDGEGNLTREVDEGGRTRRFRYRGFGRLVESVEPDGATVRYEYDTEENLVAVVNERGERATFGVDLVGRRVRERGFDGRVTRRRYDRAGRCVEVVDGRERVTRLERDALGRVVSRKHPDGAVCRYEYGADGLLARASSPDCDVRFERDAVGRVVRETVGDRAVEVRYDAAGRRVGRSTSLGHRALYVYDGNGRLRGVELDPDASWMSWTSGAVEPTSRPRRPWVIGIDRDAVGAEVARSAPGDVRLRWDRDDIGRSRALTMQRGDEQVFARGYLWQPGPLLEGVVEPERGATRFERDLRGRVVAAHRPDGTTLRRALDEAGNPFRSLERDDREYGPGGVLRQSDGARVVHDADGRLVERIVPDGRRWRYTWDGIGQLRAVVGPDGVATTFAYDALGRRVRKTAGERATAYVWDGHDLVHEVPDGASAVTWVFEPGEFVPLARVDAGGRFMVVTDPVGAPVALVDEAGEIAWQAQLDLYGVAQTDVARTACPWRFPGQYEDPETGLYYNRTRYYDASLGRYISQDIVGLLGGTNPYGYVADPYGEVDPFGLAGCPKDAQRKVRKGQGPRGISRIDSPKVKGEQWHAHLGPGEGSTAVNLDGTMKHGSASEITGEVRKFLRDHGWNL